MATNIITERVRNDNEKQVFKTEFFGTNIITTVTSTPKIIKRWIGSRKSYYRRQLRMKHLVVGLGVQWRPVYRPSTQVPADTLQLCIGTRCLIIQLSHCPSIPALLRRFLSDEDITFVGIRNYTDNKKLLLSRHHLSVSNLLNLCQVVESKTGESHLFSSMEKLVSDVLGFDGVYKDRLIGMSNWRNIELTIKQVQYAGVDAYVSFEIGKILKAWNYK